MCFWFRGFSRLDRIKPSADRPGGGGDRPRGSHARIDTFVPPSESSSDDLEANEIEEVSDFAGVALVVGKAAAAILATWRLISPVKPCRCRPRGNRRA